MALSRLLLLIIGFSLILGLMIWLITSLSWFYRQVAWSAPPFLANLLLLMLIVLLGLIIFAFFYYGRLYLQPKSRRKGRRVEPRVPEVKAEAATESLKAVRQQVAQIQDEVARQALLSRSRELEANIKRGNLSVVVFGTGSAGKTSVINAVMGRMVGQVGAPMGTTATGETYVLKLSGLEREIWLTDTPGILEVGREGTEREKLARHLATEADLLLFVVDNDLRKSEYEPLRILAEIGKRSLVVFNKIDLYTESEKESILAHLRQQLRGVVTSLDVVAVSANPQAIRLETGQTLQPAPDIMSLIRRMAALLRAEGEDLIADNILLQSQQLGDEARRLIDGQRRRQAEKVVDRFQWIGAGVIAVTPLPVVDVLATVAVNAQMVIEIGKIYGCELNLERGQDLAVSLAKTLASLGIVEGAIKLVTAALQLNIATFLVGKTIQGVTAAYLTRIAGKSVIEYFRHNQDWGDGGITEVVQRQFQLTRKDEFVKAFVKDAITRVVEPLNRQVIEPLREFAQEEEEEDELEREYSESRGRSVPPPVFYDPDEGKDDWQMEGRRDDQW